MKQAMIVIVLGLVACGEGEKFTVEQLQDPNTCKECHPKHFEQWSGSMHAYASDDPVFLAMNRRGQRDTQGRLGDFCINCHAPMAKQLGYTETENFDPNALPPAARGITCYFCHNVAEVTGTHNNGLVLANDQTMRGGAEDPAGNEAHHSKYDERMDSDTTDSAICGSCHDIVVPASVNGRRDIALERTFEEWKGTFFGSSDDPRQKLSCSACHMKSSRDVIATGDGVTVRERGFHDHTLPGIDVALTEFPQRPEQLAAVNFILENSVDIVGPVPDSPSQEQNGGICVLPDNTIRVRVDSIGVGHSWPSGAAQDRRAWLEVIAYDAAGTVVFEHGVVAPGTDPSPTQKLAFWDRAKKMDGTPAHFFWEVDSIDSILLRAASVPGEDVSAQAIFDATDGVGNTMLIDRVTARFRFNPLPYDVIDDLIASGDLAPAIRAEVKTLEVGLPTVWTRATQRLDRCNPDS